MCMYYQASVRCLSEGKVIDISHVMDVFDCDFTPVSEKKIKTSFFITFAFLLMVLFF